MCEPTTPEDYDALLERITDLPQPVADLIAVTEFDPYDMESVLSWRERREAEAMGPRLEFFLLADPAGIRYVRGDMTYDYYEAGWTPTEKDVLAMRLAKEYYDRTEGCDAIERMDDYGWLTLSYLFPVNGQLKRLFIANAEEVQADIMGRPETMGLIWNDILKAMKRVIP